MTNSKPILTPEKERLMEEAREALECWKPYAEWLAEWPHPGPPEWRIQLYWELKDRIEKLARGEEVSDEIVLHMGKLACH
jgi:hypothetical protein